MDRQGKALSMKEDAMTFIPNGAGNSERLNSRGQYQSSVGIGGKAEAGIKRVPLDLYLCLLNRLLARHHAARPQCGLKEPLLASRGTDDKAAP